MPTVVTLLVDTSQSMSSRFDFVRRATRRLSSLLRPDDELAVVPFSRTLGPMTGPTRDLDALTSAIDGLGTRGGTAIADAVERAGGAADGRRGPPDHRARHRRLRRAQRQGHGRRRSTRSVKSQRHALQRRHRRRRGHVVPRPRCAASASPTRPAARRSSRRATPRSRSCRSTSTTTSCTGTC